VTAADLTAFAEETDMKELLWFLMRIFASSCVRKLRAWFVWTDSTRFLDRTALPIFRHAPEEISADQAGRGQRTTL
jgi:hypothetical protein